MCAGSRRTAVRRSRWYRNTQSPSPIQGADTDDQLRQALVAWTDPPTASIVLAFGGTRDVAIQNIPGEDRYCTAGNLGVGLFTFGDPLDELPVGVLAIGGGCASSSTHTVNGTTFSAFTHGLVVLNDDAALEGFRTAPNITRILEHEVGHGIGLGHSDEDQNNIMYPACCPPGMPVPPAIGPDDLAGLVFIYPAPQCTFTIGPPASRFHAGVRRPADHGRDGVGTVLPLGGDSERAVGDPDYGAYCQGAGDLHVPGRGEPREPCGTKGDPDPLARPPPPRSSGGDFDLNGDGIYEDWASFYRLTTTPPTDAGPNDDPDGDGSDQPRRTGGRQPSPRLLQALSGRRRRKRVLRHGAGALLSGEHQFRQRGRPHTARRRAGGGRGR